MSKLSPAVSFFPLSPCGRSHSSLLSQSPLHNLLPSHPLERCCGGECPAEPVAKAGGLGHSEGPSQCVLCCLSPNQHPGAEVKGAPLSPASVAEGVLLLSSYAWKVLRMETQPTVP